MFKRIALPAVLIVIAMAAAGIVYVRKLRPVTVEVAEVERDVAIRVFGLGSVEAQVLSRVGFQVAGRIANQARKWRLHLPARWPWQDQLDRLYAAALGPPGSAAAS